MRGKPKADNITKDELPAAKPNNQVKSNTIDHNWGIDFLAFFSKKNTGIEIK